MSRVDHYAGYLTSKRVPFYVPADKNVCNVMREIVDEKIRLLSKQADFTYPSMMSSTESSSIELVATAGTRSTTHSLYNLVIETEISSTTPTLAGHPSAFSSAAQFLPFFLQQLFQNSS